MNQKDEAPEPHDLGASLSWCARQDFLRVAQDKLTLSCYKSVSSAEFETKRKSARAIRPERIFFWCARQDSNLRPTDS
jgi:hypothetical protein